MFLSGDEFGNTQYGNNNAYCHDDDISWLDWEDLEKNKDLFQFAKKMIAFRKKHPVVRKRLPKAACGLPGVSVHNQSPWNGDFKNDTRELGILFTGYDEKKKTDDIVFLCINMHWEKKYFILPEIHEYYWDAEIMTSDEIEFTSENSSVMMDGRSVAIFVAKAREGWDGGSVKKKTKNNKKQ